MVDKNPTVIAHEKDGVWITQDCPHCGRHHTHGSLGSKAPHCGMTAPNYILVDE